MNEKKEREELYTVIEVAKILKIGKNKVYDLIHAGLLPVIKLGGIKIRSTSLHKFLDDYEGCDLSDPYNIKEYVA
jgi:excisionase family DNA binding protein